MSELSSDAKALVESTRLGDAPSAEDKQRIRSRLAAQLGAGAFAASTALLGAESALGSSPVVGKAASPLRASWLRWLAGSLAAGGAAVAALLLSSAGPTPQAAPRELAARPVELAPVPVEVEASPPPIEPPEPAPPASPVAPAIVRPAPHSRRAGRERAPHAFAPAGPSSSLSEEIALLAEAQRALRARDGEQALRLAKRHAEYFPSGALYEERVGVEAIAHCMLGQRAHPTVRAFLARSPRSPLSARVRKECQLP